MVSTKITRQRKENQIVSTKIARPRVGQYKTTLMGRELYGRHENNSPKTRALNGRHENNLPKRWMAQK